MAQETPKFHREHTQIFGTESKIRLATREDLATLVADNPPAQVISTTNIQIKFGDGGISFTPSMFQPIQTVRIKTKEGRTVVKIRDGNHRTKLFLDFWDSLIGTDESPGAHPDFRPPIQDITDEIRAIHRLGPSTEEESTIPIALYWKDIIPYTKEHAEIESKRTMSHILTEWADAVGTAVADRISAFAAVSILSDRQTPYGDDKLPAYLQQYFAKDPDQAFLVPALLDVHEVLAYTNIGRERALQESAQLVGTENEHIGGPRERRKQLNGLLALPPVVAKFPSDSRPTPLGYLGDSLESAVERAGARIKDVMPTYITVLTDPRYSRYQVLQILTAKSPQKLQQMIDKELASQERIQTFTRAAGREPTDLERRFIDKGYTSPLLIEPYVKLILHARSTIRALPKTSNTRAVIERSIGDLLSSNLRGLNTAVHALRQSLDRTQDTPPPSPSHPGVYERVEPTRDTQLTDLRQQVTRLSLKLELTEQERDQAVAQNAVYENTIAEMRRLLAERGVIFEHDTGVKSPPPDELS